MAHPTANSISTTGSAARSRSNSQQQSIDNKKRLEARDPEIRASRLAELRDIAADPSKARQFLLRTSMIARQRRAAAMRLEDA